MLDFRFLHASDFHLEQPLYGFPSAPEHLHTLLIDAPYLAAEQVFDAAIVESVDFLLLSGDIVHPDGAGPRAVAFLMEHFERLRKEDISIYWAGGSVDLVERWPSAVALPDNVHVFSPTATQEITHYRGEDPVATVTGLSCNGEADLRLDDFESENELLYSIACVYGKPEPEAIKKSDVKYWALGGQHTRKKLNTGKALAYYPGSPQGRCPAEEGPHGCLFVHVDQHGNARVKPVITDVVRWKNERLSLEKPLPPVQIERVLKQRTEAMMAEAEGRSHMLLWRIDGSSRMGSQTREGGVAQQMLETLRTTFGHRQPAAWTVSLDIEPPASFPAKWYDEDTILGDFLREIRQRQTSPDTPLDLDPFLPASQSNGAIAAAVALVDGEDNKRVLREAAALAVDLLRGEPAK